jgi:phospholipid/cholesterol/gamma-HCH transport system substrate-binding protein
VIRDSKVATIDSLEAMAPTLTKLAEAGDALPKALQVFLTYPFVDAVVGKNPAQARNLHMGDYTNLSVQMDLKFFGQDEGEELPDPGTLCDLEPNPLCEEAGPVLETLTLAERCIRSGDVNSKACKKVSLRQLRATCEKPRYDDNNFCKLVLAAPAGTPLDDIPLIGGGGDDGGDGGGVLPGLGGLFRPAFGGQGQPPRGEKPTDYDEELGPLLVWGMMQR